jgi:hypothetical protein
LARPHEIALTPHLAHVFGVGVCGHVTYQFTRVNLQANASAPAGRSTFVVTGNLLTAVPALRAE